MNKKTLTTLIIVIVISGLLAAVIITAKNNQPSVAVSSDTEQATTQSSDVQGSFDAVLYFGNSCPHCKDVDEWLVDNNVADFINIDHREVYDNQANALELAKVAKSCQLNTNQIGVPFLYADNNCYVGKIEIIDYLKTKIPVIENSAIETATAEAEKNIKN